MNSLKKKIISSSITIGSIVAVIGFGLTSFAWFSNNKQVESTGILMIASNKQTVEIENDVYDVYGYDFINDSPIYLTGEDKNLHLGDYDYFITGRLTYDRRIARMHLKFPSGYTANSKLKIDMYCDSRYANASTGLVEPLISNVCQFKFYDNYSGKIRDYVAEPSNILDVYQDCVTTFDSMSALTFVNYTVDEGNVTINSKKSHLTTQISLPSIKNGAEVTDFVFEINYNQTLINYFAEHCGEVFDVESIKEGGSSIKFTEDITTIELNLVD